MSAKGGIVANKEIKKAPFYREEYILVIDNPDDIKKEFFLSDKVVQYSDIDKSFFSIDNFLVKLSKDIEMLENTDIKI